MELYDVREGRVVCDFWLTNDRNGENRNYCNGLILLKSILNSVIVKDSALLCNSDALSCEVS